MSFVGIDPGKKTLQTTGICVLKGVPKRFVITTKTIYGKSFERCIPKPTTDIQVVTLSSPIRFGKGKGKMRLWEKFMMTKSFRKRDTIPLPPAFMHDIIYTASDILVCLHDKGVKDAQIIETFYPLLNRVIKKSVLPRRYFFKTYHEYQAFLCAYLAYLHYRGETFWIGYGEERVHFPKPTYWYKKEWEWFEKAWMKKDPFKYRLLDSDILPSRRTSSENSSPVIIH